MGFGLECLAQLGPVLLSAARPCWYLTFGREMKNLDLSRSVASQLERGIQNALALRAEVDSGDDRARRGIGWGGADLYGQPHHHPGRHRCRALCQYGLCR